MSGTQDYHWEAKRRALLEAKRYYNAEQLEKSGQNAKNSQKSDISSTYSIDEDRMKARAKHFENYSAKLPYRYDNKGYYQQW